MLPAARCRHSDAVAIPPELDTCRVGAIRDGRDLHELQAPQ